MTNAANFSKDKSIMDTEWDKRYLWLKENISEHNGLGPTLREMGPAWGLTQAGARLTLQKFIQWEWVAVGMKNGRQIARAIRAIRKEPDEK